MKAVLLASLLTISSQAFSAEILLKITTGSGFSPVPRSTSLVITEDGKVTQYETERKLVTKTEIAKLSTGAVENLVSKIETVQDDVKLVDIDAKKPRCMDAPSTSLVLNKGGKSIEVYAVRSCHRFFATSPEVERIVNLVKGFQYLTYSN